MTIPPKVTVIPDSLFEYCWNLESVTLPDGITEIGRLAFYSNKFTSIQLPASLKKIDDKAFLSSKLSSIVIPNSVEYIGESAFQYSASLKQVKLSKNLKKIEPRSFESCGFLPLLSRQASVTMTVPSPSLWMEPPSSTKGAAS